ncbi:hypothetical protein O181_008246 [Austropuccinia psidii MF-1]|uniref:Uncharacterized protein n=1 Tax=Austropuccinia psidii MF-1 TaxID=1389203 RepID=A0A9Q3BPH2_9BASI|nr:hypothetical protein [Austropuccinia psidii MF-1]
MKEVLEKVNENKVINFEPINDREKAYKIIVNGSEIINGPPIHSRKNLFRTFEEGTSSKKHEYEQKINEKWIQEQNIQYNNINNKLLSFFQDKTFMEKFNKELKMKSDEVEYEDFKQPPMKKLKHSHGLENIQEEFMNKEIIEDHKHEEEQISPKEKQLMNSIKEYGLDTENPWRIDKEKEMHLDKEIFLNYYDESHTGNFQHLRKNQITSFIFT